MKIEDTKEYKEWEEKLLSLNNKINSLDVWDSYAESLQNAYDNLLFNLDPRKKSEKNNDLY